MATFSVDTIDLSMTRPGTDPADGYFLTANVYTMAGVNGGRPLSISQLVMAICLARATELEASIIGLMEKLDEASTDLETLTAIESDLVAGEGLKSEQIETLEKYGITVSVPYDPNDVITQIESKMDSLNTLSQETMIDLQSQTNKRDQAYDMIANILKSLNTVLVTNVNNL